MAAQAGQHDADEEPAPLREHLVEPSRVEPASDRTAPDAGTKLFVIFFMLVVPPLGIALLGAIIWSLWRHVTGGA
ncbi:MAG TPA: hypothetical protein VER17_01200 [Tepidisphaeraceae bacterium]|nr:hypothetical protein [Tepidisphaeraceae bacterium]